MKICNKCNLEKGEGEFYKNRNSLESTCSECRSKSISKTNKARRRKARPLKSKPKSAPVKSAVSNAVNDLFKRQLV